MGVMRRGAASEGTETWKVPAARLSERGKGKGQGWKIGRVKRRHR